MCSCTEIWKDIKGYVGIYKVSNFGRIKSLNRINHLNANIKGKMMKQSNARGGYKVIGLSIYGNKKQHKVHRLIAEAFIPNDDDKPFINHIDGITNNNSLDNLEWCTPSENSKHAFKIGLANAVGENNGRSTATEEDVKQIRCMWTFREQLSIDCGYKINQTVLCNIFNFKMNVIHAIVKNKTWTHML